MNYQNQKDYWDQAADTKEFSVPFMMELFMQHVPRENMILDVGCGYGRILNELYHQDYRHLYGIDFSEKMIRKGHGQYPYLDLQVQNNRVLPYKDHSFDTVLLVAVLTCIIEDQDQLSLIQEIKRVLKPQGILYISDFLLNDDQRNLDRYALFSSQYQYGVFKLEEGALLRHHSPVWIKQLTSSLKEIEFKQTVFITMNRNKSKGFYFLGSKQDGV